MFDVRGLSEVKSSDIILDRVSAGSFVLFRTGQIERVAYGEKAYFDHHPQLSDELIASLCQKKIRFIGVDSPGIRAHAEHESADRLCEQHGIFVIENLSNLEKITAKHFSVYTMWLDDPTLTGLRCKVIVQEL